MEDLAALLFSFRGRITRTMWWAGSIITSTATLAVELENDTQAPPGILATLAQLVLLWPIAAISVKRLADCDWPGWPAIVLILASSILDIGPHFGFMVDYDHFAPGEKAILIALAIPGLALVLFNGCVRGTPGPNRYGPDPLQKQVQTAI
jgi:uncharacterized membrane protein YhaH (DUF805 family)